MLVISSVFDSKTLVVDAITVTKEALSKPVIILPSF
jgi:hypothetical protein